MNALLCCVCKDGERCVETTRPLRSVFVFPLSFGPLSAPGSSDSLLGPKDASQRVSAALLDAKELLKHFSADGTPAGELQPLVVCRGWVYVHRGRSASRL